MSHAIKEVGDEDLVEFLEPIFTALGLAGVEEAAGIYRELGHEVRFAAYEGDCITGTVAVFDFEMTVPGGNFARTAGITLAAVRPTHRRRGTLRALMERCLEDARARGKPLSALFASEGAIYGRFGYGLASWWLNLEVESPSGALADASGARAGTFRLLGANEAAQHFPRIWEQLRREHPGMLSRTPAWWRLRRVAEPEWKRRGRLELQNVLYEVDGQPTGYAIYRPGSGFEHGLSVAALEVVEAMALSSDAQDAVWRYLFEMDLASELRVQGLSADHPLLLMASEPARLRPRLVPALYLRIIDVEQALGLRQLAPAAPVVLAIQDRLCPWNDGCFRVSESGAARTSEDAELSLDVTELGSVYLGGCSFRELLAAGRVREETAGSAERADALFVRGRAPWCPDIF